MQVTKVWTRLSIIAADGGGCLPGSIVWPSFDRLRTNQLMSARTPKPVRPEPVEGRPRAGTAVTRLLAALAMVAGLLAAAPAAATPIGLPPEFALLYEPVTVEPVRAEPVSLRILSAEDRKLYREIFDVQEAGKWNTADRLIARLDNDLLIGHVLYQRYMHPTKYRSRFGELAKWMKHHADHPGASRIYNLALKRRGKAQRPRRPERIRYVGAAVASQQSKLRVPKRDQAERRAVATFKSRVRREIRRGRPERAEKRFWAIDRRDILADWEAAEALARIAQRYFRKGDDEKAFALAGIGAERVGNRLVQPHWVAGLAAWRLGDCAASHDHFTAMAGAPGASGRLVAAGGYWAARAALACGEPAHVTTHLKQAAAHTETFYGLIAARQLGMDVALGWEPPVLTKQSYAELAAYSGVDRAVALTEVGQDQLADEELRLVFGRNGEVVRQPLMALAAHLGLPATQMRLGRASTDAPLAVRYPVPDWQPDGGFTVDRALMFAVVRQESEFRSRAKSRVGARGLMQIMPATASYITKDRSLRRGNRARLYEPEFNMSLGQRYIRYLEAHRATDGNLFMLAAAYNGGPGNLSRWRRNNRYMDDPLLFIETIPVRETRHYVKRVATNLWLYRMRLGQPTPSLDAVAAGAWPLYEAVDEDVLSLAGGPPGSFQYAENR